MNCGPYQDDFISYLNPNKFIRFVWLDRSVIQPEQVISVWSISVARKSLCLIHRSGSPLSLTERCIIWVQTAERARRRRTGYVLRVPAAVSSMYCTVLYMRISILYRGHLCPTAKPCMALSACSTSKTECYCYPWYYLLHMRPSGILAPIGHRTADRYLSAPARPIGGMARFAAPSGAMYGLCAESTDSSF